MLRSALLLTVLILVAFAGLTVWRAEARIAAVDRAWPPLGQFIEVEGQKIHLLITGPEEAPAVVLIHGSSGNIRDMTFRLAPALAGRYRVVLVDRPGLGWSEPGAEPATILRQAALLRAATQKAGITRPILVGHSYGGAVALAWAVEYPEDVAALVTLAGPSHPWPTPLSGYYRLLSTPGFRHLAAWILAAWVPDRLVEAEVASVFAPQPMPDGYSDHLGPRLSLRPATMLANAAQRASLLAEIEALVPRYSALAMPVEVLHGTADEIVSPVIHAEALAREVASVRYTPLPGLGHMLPQIAASEAVAAIDRAAIRAGLR